MSDDLTNMIEPTPDTDGMPPIPRTAPPPPAPAPAHLTPVAIAGAIAVGIKETNRATDDRIARIEQVIGNINNEIADSKSRVADVLVEMRDMIADITGYLNDHPILDAAAMVTPDPEAVAEQYRAWVAWEAGRVGVSHGELTKARRAHTPTPPASTKDAES